MSPTRCDLTDLLPDQCGCPQHRGGHTPQEEADHDRDPGPWITAEYAGDCARCHEPFEPGTRIRADGAHRWECCA